MDGHRRRLPTSRVDAVTRRLGTALTLLGLAMLSWSPATASTVRAEAVPLTTLQTVIDSLVTEAAYVPADSIAALGLRRARAATRTDSTQLATWLLYAGRLGLELGRHDEAEVLLEDARRLHAARGPEGKQDLLTTRRWIYRLHLDRHDADQALAWADSCLALSQELHGTDDARIAGDLVRRADVFIFVQQDNFDEAAALLDRAQSLIEEQWGPEHEQMGFILLSQADLDLALGKWQEAAPLFVRAVEFQLRHRSENHPAVAQALVGLANCEQRLGNLESAELHQRRALEIREQAYGPEHPMVGRLLNDLGVVRRRRGDHVGAVEVYRRSLAIKIRSYGEESADVALTMANLAGVLDSLGEHAESKLLLERSVEIFETVYGPNHAHTAWALSHLAQMERQRGNVTEAEAHFRRCLAIALELFGPEHEDVALYQVGIAQCLTDQGQLEEARAMFATAAATMATLLGPDHHEVARYERELATVELLLGDLDGGRARFERCVTNLETQLGPEHPALVRCLSGLTVASLAAGEPVRAAEIADRRLALARLNFGERGLRGSLVMMQAVEVAAGHWLDAVEYGLHAAEIVLGIQDDVFQVSSEREALRFAAHHRRVVRTLLADVQAAPQLPDTTLAQVFGVVARTHGRVVDRLALRRQFLELAADTTATHALLDDYIDAAENLAKLIMRGSRGREEQFRDEVSRARQIKEDAERELASASERFRHHTTAVHREIGLTAGSIATALPPGASLVHYVRFPRYTIGTPAWRPGATSLTGLLFSGGGDRYGAFILQPAATDGRPALRFADLGEAARVDSLIVAYRHAIEAVGSRPRASARQEAEYRAAARQLYETIWAPCWRIPVATTARVPADDAARIVDTESYDEDAPMAVVVPTSMLHLLDLNTLLAPAERLVIEQWRLHLLSSARDLLRLATSGSAPPGTGLLAVGNPAGTPAADPCPDALGPRSALPGAEREVARIARLVSDRHDQPVTLLIGEQASETAVKQVMPGQHIVHLATHGFFCDDLETMRGSTADIIHADPLLQCGLVLTPSGSQDGLLTAQEIATQDLRSLDWVVLSACNSGLGRLVAGEGLFGLRRAFEIGGARTVVMALWRLHDTTAQEIMQAVYAKRLRGAASIDAVRDAELERLTLMRGRYGRLHPAGWGGIVVEGDWR